MRQDFFAFGVNPANVWGAYSNPQSCGERCAMLFR